MAKSPRTKSVALDHISCSVRDLKAARKFYGSALGAIGMKINMDVSSAFGMGSRNEKVFWLARDRRAAGDGHYAFRVDHREEVDAFYSAAMGAGARTTAGPAFAPTTGPATTQLSSRTARGTTSRWSAMRGPGAARRLANIADQRAS